MKSYEQRAREILEARDRILSEKRRRRKIAERCLAGGFGVCAAVLICIGILNKPELMKPYENDNVQNTTVTTAAEVTTEENDPIAAPTTSADNYTVTEPRVTVTAAETKAAQTSAVMTGSPEKSTKTGHDSPTSPAALTTAKRTSLPTSAVTSAITEALTKPVETNGATPNGGIIVKTTAATIPSNTTVSLSPVRVTTKAGSTEIPNATPGNAPVIMTTVIAVSTPETTTAPVNGEPADHPIPVSPEPERPPFYVRFHTAETEDNSYYSAYIFVSEQLLTEPLGTAKLIGNGVTITAEIYAIDGIEPSNAIAVKADDGSGYYAYINKNSSETKPFTIK